MDMHSLKHHSLAAFLFSAAVLLGLAAPLAAFAANSSDGRLKVYVEVEDRYGDYDPSDFTVHVDGDDVSKESFRGSDDGTTVYVDGWYSVSVSKKSGYVPSYSGGCHGDLDRNDSETCRITMEDSYGYGGDYGYYGHEYYYPQQYYYPQPQYYQQATVIAKYVPGLPNTGFKPVSPATLSLALALLAVAALFATPYVRKAFAAFVR